MKRRTMNCRTMNRTATSRTTANRSALKRRILPAAFALLLATATTGCATLRGDTANGSTDPSDDLQQFDIDAEVEKSDPIAVNSTAGSAQAFAFVGTELFSDAPVSGSDLYSSGPMVVTFVSPSCEISNGQAPRMAEAAETMEEITFVFVHTDGEKSDYEEFVEEADLYQQNVIHLNDTDRALASRFNVQIHPSSLLVNAEGETLFTTGGLDITGLEKVVELVTQT